MDMKQNENAHHSTALELFIESIRGLSEENTRKTLQYILELKAEYTQELIQKQKTKD